MSRKSLCLLFLALNNFTVGNLDALFKKKCSANQCVHVHEEDDLGWFQALNAAKCSPSGVFTFADLAGNVQGSIFLWQEVNTLLANFNDRWWEERVGSKEHYVILNEFANATSYDVEKIVEAISLRIDTKLFFLTSSGEIIEVYAKSIPYIKVRAS